MSSHLIESNSYYYVSSDSYGPNVILGENPDSPGTLFLTKPSFSSDNWQIFYQDPIFLIRNYDHGAKYQLGITEASPTLPGLKLASGELTQQWNMTLWDDGTYRLTNMWLGSVQMLGVSTDTNGKPVPVMNAAQNGSHWSFAINAGAATNVTNDMLQSVSLQAAPSSTSTSSSLSTSASTAISRTPAETTAAATTSTAGSVSSSSSSSSASSQSTTSRSISGGAIAGIVVAIVAAALVVLGLLFFVWRRRRQQRHGILADQAALAQQHEEPFSTAMQEAYTRPPPSELGVSNEREGMRSRAVEMPS